MAGAIINSTSQDWNTPKWLVNDVREVLGTIDLDPCSNPHSIVGAGREVMLPEDGLEVNWCDYQNIYVNPPYGRGIDKWIKKAKDSARDHVKVIMVIPAAVDTKHWHDIVWPNAKRICFLRGRVKFDLPDKVCPNCDGAGVVEAVFDSPDDYQPCSNCAGERVVPQGGASSTVPTAVVLFSQGTGAIFDLVFMPRGKVIDF